SGRQNGQPHMVVAVVGTILILLQAPAAPPPPIPNEKASSTWSTLLATPLTAAQILIPKLIGSIKKLWFIAAIVGAELLIGLFAGRVRFVAFVHLAMIIVSVGVFLGGTGILFSLVARRTYTASLLNILLAGGLWLGVPVLGAIGAELIFRGADVGFLENAVLWINPVFMTVSATDASVSNSLIWSADMPDGPDLHLLEFTCVLGIACALGCAIGL